MKAYMRSSVGLASIKPPYSEKLPAKSQLDLESGSGKRLTVERGQANPELPGSRYLSTRTALKPVN